MKKAEKKLFFWTIFTIIVNEHETITLYTFIWEKQILWLKVIIFL